MKQTGLITVVAAALLAPPATSAGETNQWRFEVTPYVLMAGIFGEVGIGSVNRPVNVTFDKIWNNLVFFQMWNVGVGYDRWALTTDIIYLGVGATQGAADLDFNQWM
jgi:hypothetical protein